MWKFSNSVVLREDWQICTDRISGSLAYSVDTAVAPKGSHCRIILGRMCP